MSTKMIANPTGAFGPSGTTNPFDGDPSIDYIDVTNTSSSVAIVQGNLCIISQVEQVANKNWQFGVTQYAFGASSSPYLIGVAMDSIAALATGRVMVRGVAPVVVDTGGVTAGQIVQGGTATNGRITSVATASATPGINIGIVLTNPHTGSETITLGGTSYTVGLSAGNACYIYVAKF
jgi:hypothetical protein